MSPIPWWTLETHPTSTPCATQISGGSRMASPLAPSHSWGTPPVGKCCKHKNKGEPGFSPGEPHRAEKSMVSFSVSVASTHIPLREASSTNST